MPIRPAFGMLFIAGLIAALAGCGKKPTIPSDPTPAPPVASNGPAVTEDEAKKFGTLYVESLKAKDRAKFEKLIHLQDFSERCYGGLGLSPAELKKNAGQLNVELGGIYDQIASSYDVGGAVKLLGQRLRDGRMEAVLRLNGDGFNYIICQLTRFPDGTVGMEDFTFVSNGEPASLTMRRPLIPAVKTSNGSNSALSAKEQIFVTNFATQKAASQALIKNDPSKALKILDGLPQVAQDEKAFALLRVFAANRLDDETYQREIERFIKQFPNDPCMDFHALSYFQMKRDWKRGLESVERLDQFVGGDQYLNTFRVPFLIMAGRTEEAKFGAEKLMTAEPELSQSYHTLALYLVSVKNYADAAETFKKASLKFDSNPNIGLLQRIPDFAEFVKSKECAELKAWADARPKK